MNNEMLKEYSIIQNNHEYSMYHDTYIPPLPIPSEPYSDTLNYGGYISSGNTGNLNTSPRKRQHNCEPVEQYNIERVVTNVIGRDRSYPDELNLLINPLFCELCNVKLNSEKTATCHYESKIHDRKITNWLAIHYPDNPPVVKRFLKSAPTGPEAFHCEICDLPLTSMLHAKQHYAGRKHQLVANKKSVPSGAGYYNPEGKWIRTGSKKSKVNSDRRFGIGTDFLKGETTATYEHMDQGFQEVSSSKPVIPKNESLWCKICSIHATSDSQMKMHLSGARHQKKVNANFLLDAMESNDISMFGNLSKPGDSISWNLSMYRTPTGSYYCQICNMTMNNVTVLQQHLDGKKHKFQAKPKEGSIKTSPHSTSQ